jgi:hypothetical protein
VAVKCGWPPKGAMSISSALAAYARQMKDTKLLNDARRIQDRAIRRGGELFAAGSEGEAGAEN